MKETSPQSQPVILSAVRTPIGKFLGALGSLSATELGAIAVRAAVQRAGLNTAALVAYAEDCGPCWEKFSCLLTEAATGSQNLEHFLRECRAPAERRRSSRSSTSRGWSRDAAFR